MTDRDRGAGRLKGAFGQIRRSGAGGEASGGAPTAAPVPRRRRRQKTGKRSRPEEYAQASGFVRHAVVDRKDQALADPEVRRALEAELARAGVEFKSGDPDYGAMCELLVMEWLESVGYGFEAR
ncbi:MAG: hypothetical protein ACR2HO_04850 [Rubrobacteraceae bacterium]